MRLWQRTLLNFVRKSRMSHRSATNVNVPPRRKKAVAIRPISHAILISDAAPEPAAGRGRRKTNVECFPNATERRISDAVPRKPPISGCGKWTCCLSQSADKKAD